MPEMVFVMLFVRPIFMVTAIARPAGVNMNAHQWLMKPLPMLLNLPKKENPIRPGTMIRTHLS
ncbi:MAG: hypothetical protein H8E36_11335 [Rhodospirillaceae bacterium]|nr:hypothetical protein [Rhodospirillaceae bacterium]MBL6940556.1 hypothetical protein [Rhodospirillales bacterium]